MNWTDIQQWKSGRLRRYAAECEDKQRRLQPVGDALAARLDSLTGSGQTGKAAKAALRKQITAIEKEVNFLISSAEIASEGAQGINEVRANADDAKQLAQSWNMTIDSSGNVSMDAAQVKRHQDSGISKKEIQSAVDTAQKRVNTALEQAQKLVDILSQKLASLEAGTFDNHVHYSATIKSRPTLPPADASPQENASWWNSLSEEDKQWMIREHPDRIGNLEGVDYTSRNQANRIMLPRLQQQAKEELDAYRKKAGWVITPSEALEIQRLKDRVKALNEIDKTLKKSDSDGVDRYLMQLDPSGPNINAAISRNNPDTADHIGVLVSGWTTDVADSIDAYDNHTGALLRNAEAHAKPGETVAMVEYFGYDAPQHVDVASANKAKVGGPKLAGFLTGLDAAREHGAGDAHITLAGHSYGSTTAGVAATLVGDGVIDDLVQFGSPGSGVQSVDEFHVQPGHVYVSAAPYKDDVVQGLGPDDSFGKNPTEMPGYTHLSGDVGGKASTLPTLGGKHNTYFEEDTQANRDIASVMAGNPNV